MSRPGRAPSCGFLSWASLFAIVVAVIVVAVVSPRIALAQTGLPDQMVFFPLEGDPISDEASAPLAFVSSVLELPDGRYAIVHRLSFWKKIGESHAARLELSYVGLESKEKYQYGGGRTTVRWTSRMGSREGRGFALDVAGNLPTGDPTLFPFSARAPMLEGRLRWSAFHPQRARLWVGWWGMMVSPPSSRNRQDPLTGFASGSGVDAMLELDTGRLDTEWMLALPTQGTVHRVFRWSVTVDWSMSDDLAVRTGLRIDTGRRVERRLDYAWELGLSWRPSGKGD